jgi:hypothetical protein
MKTQINEIKRMQLLAGVINESQLNEDVLELKSVAKKIFSILKKYNLKPTYNLDGKQFTSKAPQTGYGAEIALTKDNVLVVAVYDRGIWQTIQRKESMHELDMGPVAYPSAEEKKQINQIASQIYKDIVSTLGPQFEFKSQPQPDEYGNYLIFIKEKTTAKGGAVNPNQRPNAPKPAAQPQQESFDQLDEIVDKVLAKVRSTK